MARLTVENFTGKAKAVREAGGMTVIKSGDKATVETDWSDEYRAKLEGAGLVIKSAQGRPKADKADDKPEADDK